MGKLLEQRNRALDDINAGRTVKKIRDLESRVRELEEENARLKAAVEYAETIRVENIAYFEKQLAASQLREIQLREALEVVSIAPQADAYLIRALQINTLQKLI